MPFVTTDIADANANSVTPSINILSPVVNWVDDKAGNRFAGNQRPSYDPFLPVEPPQPVVVVPSCMSHNCATVGDSYFSGWPSLVVEDCRSEQGARDAELAV